MTFDNEKLYQMNKELDNRWEIKNHDYERTFKQEIKITKITKEPEIIQLPEIVTSDVIAPDIEFKSSDFTVSKFRAELDNFTTAQLNILAEDERKTISNEAKKQLEKLVL